MTSRIRLPRRGRGGRRLGPVGWVVLVTVLAVGVVGYLAARDLRDLAAEPGVVGSGQQSAGERASRADTTSAQVAVRVRVSSDGPFAAAIIDAQSKEKSYTSDGDDLVVTRVFEGPGPYLKVSAQIAGSGTVRCRIDVNGKKVTSAKESGAFVVTTCLA